MGGHRSGNGRPALSIAALLSAAGILTLIAPVSWGNRTGPGFQIAGAPPLSAEQREARERYWLLRRGLQFGVPEGAYRNALGQMRQMESAQVPAVGSAIEVSSSPKWIFIGPEAMTGAQANFGGCISGLPYVASGRVTAIAADPTTSGRIFVGAANGGVWMSTNGGLSFTSIFDAEPTQAIGAIALDPVNTTPPTIYVGTGEGNRSADSYYGQGIFKSTDLGSSWTALSPGTFDHVGFSRLALDASHQPPHIFAAATPFVYSAGRADPAFAESDLTKGGLWLSTDGGSSWSQYSTSTFGCGLNPNPGTMPCPATDVVIDPADAGRVYAAIESDGVFVSSNGGTSWAAANLPGVGAGLNRMKRTNVAVGPPSAGAPLNCGGGTKACGTVYAMVGAPDGNEYVGFFSSTDGGVTWTAGTVPSTTLGPGCPTIDGAGSSNYSQSFYDQTLLVSPTDPSTVFFGGVGLYESTNGGASWSFLPAHGGTHADQHALAVAPDGNTVFVGNDGGVFKFSISAISDGIASFTSLNMFLPVGQIQGIGPHPTNDSALLAGFQDNGTDLFTGPLYWDQVQTGDGGFTIFDRVNSSVAYHTYAAGGTVVQGGLSSNGGFTWSFFYHDFTGLDVGFAFYPPLAADPSVTERVLLGGHHVWVVNFSNGTVLQQTAQDLTGGCSGGSCALQDIGFAPSDRTKAWAVSMHSGATPFRLFNTTQGDLDSGAAWTDVTPNLGFSPAATQATGIAPDPNNSSNAWLSVSGFTAVTGIGHVFKTTDFGASWTRADGESGASPLPDIPVLRLLVDKSDTSGNTVYAATDIGVFRSTDGGASWAAFNLGVIPAVPVFDIEQNNNGTIFVGTHGRGAYRFASTGGSSDKTAPSITITAPANGATYGINQQVPAKYSCTDPDDAVTTCAGPVADGSNIDTTAGSHNFTVNATDSHDNNSSRSAAYMVPAAIGPLTVAPARVSFGKQAVGSSSRPKFVKVKNRKSNHGYGMIVSMVTGTHQFTVDRATTNCGLSLPPGKACKIGIVFNPTTSGPATDTLTINDNGSNAAQQVGLSGTGE